MVAKNKCSFLERTILLPVNQTEVSMSVRAGLLVFFDPIPLSVTNHNYLENELQPIG